MAEQKSAPVFSSKAFPGYAAPDFKKEALLANGTFGDVSLADFKGKFV